MRLLIDENVPRSVAEFFESRGHEVEYVKDLFPARTPDPVIAVIGDRLSAVVVTWDKDFDSLVSRVPAGNKAAFRKLGRISFSCREPRGLALAQRWMPSIEFHYAQALERPDLRMIVQVMEGGFKSW
jgi:predicted nuclease of predicted toxin-antitoxin system